MSCYQSKGLKVILLPKWESNTQSSCWHLKTGPKRPQLFFYYDSKIRNVYICKWFFINILSKIYFILSQYYDAFKSYKDYYKSNALPLLSTCLFDHVEELVLNIVHPIYDRYEAVCFWQALDLYTTSDPPAASLALYIFF